MKSWEDLTPEEQGDYDKGVVKLYGFQWDCYYKYVGEDLIEIYCANTNYTTPSYTHYKSLVHRGLP